MATPIAIDRPLPDAAQKEIESVIDNVDRLLDLLQRTAQQKPEYPLPRVIRQCAEQLGMKYGEARHLLNALDNLREFKQQLHYTAQVLSVLRKRLDEERVSKLASHEAGFARVIDIYCNNHPFSISTKAERLSYLHENLLQDSEVITDARPIFNEDGSSIIDMIVTHSLVVSAFRSGWNSERYHFAMDAADVLHLRDLCDRAIKKTETIKTSMANCEWGVRVLNESND